MKLDSRNGTTPEADSEDNSMVFSFNESQIVPGTPLETPGNTLSVDTATAPLLAANHIVLKADKSPKSKFVGVLVEEHHHYSDGCKKQPEKTFQPNRNALSKLIAKYKVEEGWMYPLPWVQSLKLEPEEFYVELTLDAYNKTGLCSKGLNVKVEEVFDPLLPGGLPVQKVLVQGNAGYGKSSLCQKAVYDWAHGITTFRNFPWGSIVPILVKLRYLDQAPNLEELILDLIGSCYTPQDEDQEVISFMKSLGRNLIIILDGYDELDVESQCRVINVLESWKHKDSPLSCASILVTTRPTSDEKFLMLFEKHYFIHNISADNVELLIRKFNTYAAINECVSWFAKFLSRFSRYPKTRLLEKCFNKQLKKKVCLRGMPALIIAVICWVIKGEERVVDFKSNDIIYSCIELLSKRCNQREKFGFTDDHVEKVLFKFGLLCFKIEKTVIEENILLEDLKLDFPFLVQTGILKCSGRHQGLTLWEPVHKSFLDALVHAALVCDEDESLSPNEIKEFLNSEITTNSDPITLHTSHAENRVVVGGTEFGYCSRGKTAFLKWNEKYKNVSFLHWFNTSYYMDFSLNFKHFDTETLEVFTKDFPNFMPVVANNILIQDILNVQGVKQYTMSLGLKTAVKNCLNLFFPGTRNVFAKLLTYGIRFITIERRGYVIFTPGFLDKLFGLPLEYTRPGRSPTLYFSDVNEYFRGVGLDDWEIAVHFTVDNKATQHSYTLRYNSEECSRSQCRWDHIKQISINMSVLNKSKPLLKRAIKCFFRRSNTKLEDKCDKKNLKDNSHPIP